MNADAAAHGNHFAELPSVAEPSPRARPAPEPAPRSAASPPGLIRRGIVVTHGVGDQRRGDQLDIVVAPLVAFLSQALGHRRVRLNARTVLDDDGIASATIHILSEDQLQVLEEWRVREAWWAQSFRPSSTSSILSWATIQFVFHSMATVQNVVARNLDRLFTRQGDQDQGLDGPWSVAVSGDKWLYALNVVNWLIITACYAFVYLVGFVLILPVVVFLAVPRVIWPDLIGRLQAFFVSLITGGIGDQQAMTTRYVPIAAAANTVATALWPFLAPEAKLRGDDEFDTVTVVAHSGGCVVSYAALVSEEVRRWLADWTRRGEPDPSPRRLAWITVGSGLDLAWYAHPRNHAKDEAFWSRRLQDYVNWIDVYSRYDPVPQGSPADDMVQAMGWDPAIGHVSIRVANDDWPLSDHGAYWWNHEEAMSRIVYAIANSALTRTALDPHEKWASPAGSFVAGSQAQGVQPTLLERARTAIQTAPQRRARVAQSRCLSLVVLVVVAWVLFGDDLWLWLLRSITLVFAAAAVWRVVGWITVPARLTARLPFNVWGKDERPRPDETKIPRWLKGWLILVALGLGGLLLFAWPRSWYAIVLGSAVALWALWIAPWLQAQCDPPWASRLRLGAVVAVVLVGVWAGLWGDRLLYLSPVAFLADAPVMALARWAQDWQVPLPGLSLAPWSLIPAQVGPLRLAEPVRVWLYGAIGMALLGFVATILWAWWQSVVAWFRIERDVPDRVAPAQPTAAPPVATSEPPPLPDAVGSAG
jgi:hypothetical protein